MSERGSLLPSQDGGPGTLVKSSRDHSPAVALPHQVYPYGSIDAPSHYGIPSMAVAASYEAVMRNISFKQAAAAAAANVAAISVDQRADYQQHSDQRYRDVRDAELSQQQQRSSALLVNANLDRPIFPSSPHRAVMYHQHQHVTSYASPRPPPVVLDSSSTVKRPRLMSDFADIRPLHVEVEPKRADSVTSGSAYKPQVEAISPTLPADDAHGNEIRHSIDELVSQIHRVDRDIQSISNNIEKLKRKQEQIEEEAKKPVEEKMAASEPNVDVRSQSISQTIYAENRQKVAVAHAALNKFGKPTIMPLYAQPSDTAIFHENKAKFSSFKKTLILFLKKQQQAAKIRERYLSDRYDKLLETWSKRLEKMEKRRLKDTKTREFFEKVFPEMKKQREDKERLQRVSGTRFAGYARSDANVEQIVENLHEQEKFIWQTANLELDFGVGVGKCDSLISWLLMCPAHRQEEERKMRNLAVIPPMLFDARQRARRYHNEAGLLDDAGQVNMESMSRMLFWTAEEKDIFREKYLQRPKNFGFIAAALENKTASDCVLFYYTSKKSAMYKQLVRRHNATSKKRRFRPQTGAAAAAAAAAQAACEVKEKKSEPIEQEPVIEDKKTETDSAGKRTPNTCEESDIGHAPCSVDSAPPTVDSESVVQPRVTDDPVENIERGELNVDGSLPCQDNAGDTGTNEKAHDDGGVPFLASPGNARSQMVVGSSSRVEKVSERPGNAIAMDVEVKSSELLKNVNNAPSELTAAQLIEAIIAQETGSISRSSNRRRTASRSSNCSDHTSDTLSADESQYEDDRDKGSKRLNAAENARHRSNSSAAGMERRGNDQLAILRAAAGDVTSQSNLLTYQTLMQNSLLGGKLNQVLKEGSDGKNVSVDMAEQRFVLQNSGAVLLPVLAADRRSMNLKGASNQLRVRDVIHSAIEDNLQMRPLASDPNVSRSAEERWKMYTQQSQSSIENSSPRLAEQISGDSSQVQDLSCRRSDGGLSARDSYSASSRAWPSDGSSGRKLLSPPPAHSNYRPQSMSAVQIDPRSQNPLYHLAEVADQRERAEIVDHHPRVASPLIGLQHDQGVLPHFIGGSISQGTPLHSVLVDGPHGRSLGLGRHDSSAYGGRLEPSDGAKSHRDSGVQVPNPQVIAMAEDVLQYLNPPMANQRAVMERTIAAIQPHVPVGSNTSNSVLKSDFLTAQQMSNPNFNTSRHRMQLKPDHSSVSHSSSNQQPVQYSFQDSLDMREPHNGVIPRSMVSGRQDMDRSVDGMLPVMPPARPLTAASVIEAIITQQINIGSSNQTDLINRTLEQSISGVPERRLVVNGTLANGIPVSTAMAGMNARTSVNERIEMERNSLPGSRHRLGDRQLGSAQSIERAVTLGEHIDAMIQKDFTAGHLGDDAPHYTDSRYSGSSIDAGTKTSLRSFLENSADFNANSSSSSQDMSLQNGLDAVRGNMRRSPAMMMGSNSNASRSIWQRDALERDARSGMMHPMDSSVSSANHSGLKLRGRSPPSQVANSNSAPVGSAAAFMTSGSGSLGMKSSSAGPTFSLSSIPTSHGGNIALNRHVASPFGQAALPGSLPIVQHQLQDVLNAANALKAGALPWPSMLASNGNTASDAGVRSAVGAGPEEESPPAATVWKKKLSLSHELQRQEQERLAEQKNGARSRPSSRSVTPGAAPSMSSDLEKSRQTSDQGMRSTQQESLTAQSSSRSSFSSSWLNASGSRDGFGEPSSQLKSASPRSPKAPGVGEKPLSTIALSHQTMSSLLQSRPAFNADKAPADGTSTNGGRSSAGSETSLRPSSIHSDSVMGPSGLPESPSERPMSTGAEGTSADRVVTSPQSQGAGQPDALASNEEAQK